MKELFVSISDAAKMLCIAEKTARNWLTLGKFPVPSFKIGSKRVVRISDITQFAEGLGLGLGMPQVPQVAGLPVPQQKSRGRPRKT